MNIHHNARLTPLGRERMVRAIVEGRQMPQAAARAAGVCPRTARKWVARFKAEGLAGLADRSSRPQRLRQPTSPAVVDQVMGLSGILCAGPVDHHARMNLSSNMMANWVFASPHSRGDIFHSVAV